MYMVNRLGGLVLAELLGIEGLHLLRSQLLHLYMPQRGKNMQVDDGTRIDIMVDADRWLLHVLQPEYKVLPKRLFRASRQNALLLLIEHILQSDSCLLTLLMIALFCPSILQGDLSHPLFTIRTVEYRTFTVTTRFCFTLFGLFLLFIRHSSVSPPDTVIGGLFHRLSTCS